MCGIYGLLGDITESKTPADIFGSFQKLKSRGPDRSLIVFNKKCFIGFHILSRRNGSNKLCIVFGKIILPKYL